MKFTVDIPDIAECGVTECVYNTDRACHAHAITVGDGIRPGCDTYMSSTVHTKARERRAGVGACKVTGCVHNDDFECSAQHIHVGFAGQSVNCLTFTAR